MQRAGFLPHQVEVGGCRLEYWELEPKRRNRERPPLLLLHGLGAQSVSWLPVVPYLRGAGWVWALDFPGHGRSHRLEGVPPFTPRGLAALVARFLETRTGSRPVVVAGHSLGGWVAGWLAADHPERVAALALLAPAGADTSSFQELQPFFAGVFASGDIEALWRRVFARIPWWIRWQREEALRILQREDLKAIVLEAGEDELLGEGLARQRMPVYIGWGGGDQLIGPDCYLYFRRLLPHAECTEWPGASHALPLDVPRELGAWLLNAVARAETGGAGLAHRGKEV